MNPDKPAPLSTSDALKALERAETLLSQVLSSPNLEKRLYAEGREVLNGARAARVSLGAAIGPVEVTISTGAYTPYLPNYPSSHSFHERYMNATGKAVIGDGTPGNPWRSSGGSAPTLRIGCAPNDCAAPMSTTTRSLASERRRLGKAGPRYQVGKAPRDHLHGRECEAHEKGDKLGGYFADGKRTAMRLFALDLEAVGLSVPEEKK